MKKYIVVLLLFALSTVAFAMDDAEYYLFDKRTKVSKGETVFTLVFVRKNQRDDYKDFLENPKFRFNVDEDTYDRFVEKATYTLSDLKLFGMKIDAEQSEKEQEFAARIRAEQEKSRQEAEEKSQKQMQENVDKRIKELPGNIQAVRECAITLASDSKVTAEEMQELRDKVYEYAQNREYIEIAGSRDAVEEFDKEYAQDIEMANEARRVSELYFSNPRKYSDNSNNDVANFFKQAAGLEKINVKSKKNKDWFNITLWGFLIGYFFAFVSGKTTEYLIKKKSDNKEKAETIGSLVFLTAYIIWILLWIFWWG